MALADLPSAWVIVAGIFSATASMISLAATIMHLKHYRRPNAQRFVVRIIWMVPIYAVSSWISLVSLNAAFYVDALRDIYEAFVVYCFFNLLVTYLGGERELLNKLHARPPVEYIWPVRLWAREMDAGDPYTFLSIKRGILQFVYIKPILSLLTMLLKVFGAYNEDNLSPTSGYLWITLVYNVTFSWCLYCLSMFFLALHRDLEPFRAVPKFFCIKAIIFFSFWQGVGISLLVKLGVIHSTDVFPSGHIALAVQNSLICMEMVPAAFGHWYAFSYRDYITPGLSGRLPLYYAFRDAFGHVDVWQDTLETVAGTQFNYRTFEPADGVAASWQKRINTGLRYSQGGRNKYWLADEEAGPSSYGSSGPGGAGNSDRFHNHWGDDMDAEQGMLGFVAATQDVEAEGLYAEARDMMYGDFNSPPDCTR
ncbi:organic solute transporter Ostalpha-domain-containing protein [Thamnocephalis sphaerospora]|uniref:Organic solute transporter Ostalpha-domain-containing protein n=1 Tax=Thamnocephalis sphaerospora TaxID=78915 RepID=A0A4P9XJQ5_9FUNG|nr:organic solute transporter Ostalpha-domain-containing protein [Thamnocephalis sphaerospora]|eukprot:RKP05420.1 organic solute transporter Ostalpha-domain-containing protein [Thamnocephalis sphaerospora]